MPKLMLPTGLLLFAAGPHTGNTWRRPMTRALSSGQMGRLSNICRPNTVHQKITWFLFRLFSAFAERFDLGLVGAAPTEVKLWVDGPAREPDVFFLTEFATRLSG